MTKLAASLLAAALVVVLALAAIGTLAAASIRISEMSNAALRFLAFAGTAGVGVAWLLATVYLATHLAVRLFGNSKPPQT